MIEVPKKIINQVKEGEATIKDIAEHLQNNYTLNDILLGYAELLVTAEEYINRPPITVTRQEYEAIMAMFKIKGIKVLDDGTAIEETRGRPPKHKLFRG